MGLAVTVNRAFWLGKQGNEIDESPNTTAYILLGRYANERWEAFENQQQFPRRWDRHDYDSEGDDSTSRKIVPFTAGDVEVEVEVFNRHKGDLYLCKKFTLHKEDPLSVSMTPD